MTGEPSQPKRPAKRPPQPSRILHIDEVMARQPPPTQADIDCYWHLLGELRRMGMVERDGLNIIRPEPKPGRPAKARAAR